MEERAGKTFVLKEGVNDPVQGMVVAGAKYRVEDRWDVLTGKSWTVSDGNPAAMQYGMRAGFVGLPVDDDVWYGKIELPSGIELGHLVHESEIGDEAA